MEDLRYTFLDQTRLLFLGEMEGVERARARVREQTPLVFTFDLPIIPSLHTAPDASDPFLHAIQEQYNVQVSTIGLKVTADRSVRSMNAMLQGCSWDFTCSRVTLRVSLALDSFSPQIQSLKGLFLTSKVSLSFVNPSFT